MFFPSLICAASLSEEGIKNIVSIIDKLPKTFGTGVKKFLSVEKKAQSQHSQENITITNKMEYIFASVAKNNFLTLIQNMIPVQGGQVVQRQFPKKI